MRTRILMAAGALGALGFTPAAAQAPGMDSAVIDESCDRQCLFGLLDDYVEALVAQDPDAAPFVGDVVFTENNVVLPIGDGLWRTVTNVSEKKMRAADPQTGNAAWFGVAEEQGNPVFFSFRLKAEDREIAEIETVVVRLPDGPKPFGDPDADHAPEWDEVLPEDEQLPRERLMAIADGYFDTVELNDGQTFTEFSSDCGRLENGISTTASTGGGAASFAQGCEAQFRLGMYRINKRIRERQYPIIDTERGIVVATGFFDHNNWFDRYELNDGRFMNTALVWPNSISLIEAFRIKPGPLNPIPGNDDPDAGWRDGEIQRIEATFTYVPYSMHNPFAGPEADLPDLGPAPGGAACDAACLTDLTRTYLEGMVAQDPSGVPWTEQVHFSENGVKWMIGDAIWGTASAVSENAVVVADPEAGSVVWFGEVEEHGQPAYAAVKLDVRDGKIAGSDIMAAREEHPGAFAPAAGYTPDAVFSQTLDEDERTSRAVMTEMVGAYYAALPESGDAPDAIGAECRRVSNGVTEGACAALLQDGDIETVRGGTVLAVDEARGVVAALAMADLPLGGEEMRVADGQSELQDIPYPYTQGRIDLFKIVDGTIQRVEGVAAFLPYRMPIAQR